MTLDLSTKDAMANMEFNLPIILISLSLLLLVIILYARAQHRLILSQAALNLKHQVAQRHLSDLISALPGVVYRSHLSPEWPMEFISDGILKLTGYPPEAFYPYGEIRYGDLVHPDDRTELFERIDDASKHGAPFTINYRLIDKCGREHWVLENGFKTSYGDSKEEILEGFIIDISQIKWDSRALRQTELHFQRISDALPLAFFETDSSGQFSYMNQTGFDLFGFSKAQFKSGVRLLDVIAPEELNLASETLQSCQKEGGMQGIQVQIVRSDQEKLHTLFEARPINEESPEEGFVGYFLDITDRLNALREIEEERSEQQKLARRIMQMEKMDAIGQLAGGVAHDFNNQMGVILGYAEMLQEHVSDPVQQRYLSHMIQCAHHAADLTRKLLAFARKGKFRFLETNLHTLISDVSEILSHTIDKNISIKLSLEAKNPFTFGDPSQLQNALMNLAINARDAMAEGGVLHFRTSERYFKKPTRFDLLDFDLESGHYVQVIVSDSGSGIESELMTHIFEPFFTTKEMGNGSGMGLAAVYGTIKNHKGAIDLTSKAGEGTSFTLFLPQSSPPSDSKTLDPEPVTEEINARILVIDDEKHLRAMLNDLLHSLGSRAHFFENGNDAVAHYKKNFNHFDLILLDMVMPGMSGQESFRALRQINPNAKIILISGYSIDGAAQELIDEGAVGFIQKPFERATLIKNIQQTLRQETPV